MSLGVARSISFDNTNLSDLCAAQRCFFQGTLRVRIWFQTTTFEMGKSAIAMMSL